MIFVILLFVSVVLYVKIQYFKNLGYKFFIYIAVFNSAIEISLIYFQNNKNKSQINSINTANNNDDDCNLKNKTNYSAEENENVVDDFDKQHKLESDELDADTNTDAGANANQNNIIVNENEINKSENNQSNTIDTSIEAKKIEDSDGQNDIKNDESDMDENKNYVDINKNDININEDELENSEPSVVDASNIESNTESNIESNKNIISQEIDNLDKNNNVKSEISDTSQDIDIDEEDIEIKKLEKFDQNNSVKKENSDIQFDELMSKELNALKINEIYSNKTSDIEIQNKINANNDFNIKPIIQKIFNTNNTFYNHASNSQRSMMKLAIIAIISYCFDLAITKYVSNNSMQKLIIAFKLLIYLKSFSIKGILLCIFKIILWLTIFAYYKDFFENHRRKKHITFTILYAALYCMEFQ